MERVLPIGVVVSDLSLSLLKKGLFSAGGKVSEEVKLLRNITADIPGGQVVAIMGGSGSGKTTLINSMAGRMHGKNIKIQGDIKFTDQQVSVGYVLQTDFLLPYLTVRETLQYAADLRLPSSMSKEAKRSRVEEVILELGLKDCANTRIGNEMVRGVSGGEKRRVSIACQMLTNPSVLFLDEPTTGLDSFTAHNIVETLSNMAKQGRTVICSIHQPRSDIFHMLDSIMLLSKGRLAYWGKSADIFGYFATLGYECPENVNPADFFLDVVSIDYTTPEYEEESKLRVEKLVQSYEAAQAKAETSNTGANIRSSAQYSVYGKVRVPPTSALIQTSVLIRRAFLCIVRDRFLLFGGFFEAVLLGLLLGGIFYNNGKDDSLSGLKTRLSLLYLPKIKRRERASERERARGVREREKEKER